MKPAARTPSKFIPEYNETANNRGRRICRRVFYLSWLLLPDNEKMRGKEKRGRLISVDRCRVTYFVFTTSYLEREKSGKERERRFWRIAEFVKLGSGWMDFARRRDFSVTFQTFGNLARLGPLDIIR